MTTKFIIGIIAIYILYYLIQIIYDLYFKKEKRIDNRNNQIEEFEILSGENNIPQNVAIDDVEEISSPESFSLNEKAFEFEQNDENLKAKFEEEAELEKTNSTENKEPISKKEVVVQNWKNIMELATTSIKVIETKDGQRIYSSTMITD